MTRRGGAEPPATPAEREIRQRLRARGSLTFAEFMELALYAEQGGYYTREGATTGPEGDFFTAPDATPAFGETLARQVAEIWDRLGRPSRFELVESGPGRGRLARDLLSGLAAEAPGLRDLLVLTLDEVSPSLRRAQEEILGSLMPPERIRWESAPLASRPPRSWTGVLVANELLDAFPVHRVRRRGGALREICVEEDGEGRLVEAEREPGAEVEAYALRFGAAPGEGDEAEVGLAAARWMEAVSASLERGALLLVDYGHEAARLFGSEHRAGTLLAYHRHRTVDDLLARPGLQDLTAHVNWTAVDEAAARGGLSLAGRTSQDRALLALGLWERFLALARPAGKGEPEALREQLALKTLILPQAMGRRFQLSIYVRGIPGELRALGPVEIPPGLEGADEDGFPPPEPPRRRIRKVSSRPGTGDGPS